MNAELTRQAAAMKQRAMKFAGAVGGRTAPGSAKAKPKPKPPQSSLASAAPKSASASSASAPLMSIRNYAAAAVPQQFRTKNKLGVLKMIVDKLRERHIERETEPLTFEEILKAINYSDMSPNMRDFLEKAIRDNPKISCKDGGKFVYKPLYSNLKNSSRLVGLLKKKEDEGLPAVLLTDIRESMPKCEKAMKNINDSILTFTRPDKQVVVFHNDPECHLPVRSDYQQLWRRISVEGLSDQDIEMYLNKAGISTMKGQTLKPPVQASSRKKRGAKRNTARVLNSHLDPSMLKDYSTPEERK